MDDQNRNVIIALVLSFAILFGFQILESRLSPPKPPPKPPAAASVAAKPPAPGEAPATVTGVGTVRRRAVVLAESPRIKIETPRLVGSIDLIGARLDDLTLRDYHETVNPSSPDIRLLSPDGTSRPYYADFGWVQPASSSLKLPSVATRWTASAQELTPQQPVDLTWDNGQGLRFIRHYAVDDNYMFTVTETVQNTTDHPVSLATYARIVRIGKPPESTTYLLHEGPIAVLNGILHDGGWFASPDPYNYADVKKASLKKEPVTGSTVGGWLGFTDKYWLTALIPPQKQSVTTEMRYNNEGHRDVYEADYTGDTVTVAPHAQIANEGRFFAGAKEVHLLDSYEARLGIPRFDRAIDFGLFYWITKPIFLTLDLFYNWIGNFGLAIMLLTVLIKLIFFPLANKSYRAMAKMKALQPEMKKLKERFGDDKARLQQETMALYKRIGANPMAGCLPIFVQIPVFFALYKVLYVTIEMRQQPFFGWIHDLSAPDPTSFANLFGLLPFAVPHISFLEIGAWPILMGCTQFLQQRLNPQAVDPMQAKMMMFLPIVFTFMLAHFAAGLVIYWSWNNLLSIAQQWVIMRRSATAPATA
jgi:YidC/Oxa1 family membrane protein insertase